MNLTALPSNLRKYVRETDVGKRAWSWYTHQRTSLYLLSFPKTGRTWLRLMMGKALADELHLDIDPMDLARFYQHAKQLPRMRVTHDDNPQLKRPDEVERDKTHYAGKDIIFLVRDPRDTMISYYFQASRRRDRFHGTPGEFLRHDVGSLDTIIAYYNVWAEARTIPRSFTLVRYEDLHKDPVTEVERCLRVVGTVPPRAVVEAAVEFSRFDNMRKLEAQAAKDAAARLKPGDAADTESFKTRKGKVGGFREYLSPDEIAYLNERIASTLSPFYAEYLPPR
ncbi:MAG TPA: sulfotransferase domain-containing protein [Kofleriaceae bacterium]|nr:sulfotransferase domain-containing protein [Kofleriaceae bacterium]